ncbi:MAG TPA: hypothetical protein VGN63_08710 [Flavisolibacter sp.]|jgi:hypothetical protein|nr:hypothetical protein [Flavisolibacter sp.]
MSERIHALAQHLLGKSSVEECSLEELQHLTKRYPFFAPAQFLLLQKLKETGSPDAAVQQRKAVLYFHDPLQFDHFLSADSYTTDDFFSDVKECSGEIETETNSGAPEFATEETIPVINVQATQENEQNDSLIAEPHDTPLADTGTVFPEPDIVKEETFDHSAEPLVLPVEPLPEEHRLAAQSTEESETPTAPVAENVKEETPAEPVPAEVGTNASEKSPAIVAQINPPTPAKGGDILFEPYHTVDYFASQGIKVTANDLSKDKLSKQLRSFTEWLKVMKRLPATEMSQSPQSTAEKSVVHMASHSVEESEIVTEAMAEVWAKQGAHEKAIETYNKLSLLNPSKKAYFAAKIENLKGS